MSSTLSDSPTSWGKKMLYVSTYEFKCNIAKYMRRLRYDEEIEAIVLKQYNKSIGLIVPFPDEGK